MGCHHLSTDRRRKNSFSKPKETLIISPNILTKTITANGSDPQIRDFFLTGEHHLKEGDYKKAEEAFCKAFRRADSTNDYPSLLQVLYKLAETFELQNKIMHVAQMLNSALSLLALTIPGDVDHQLQLFWKLSELEKTFTNLKNKQTTSPPLPKNSDLPSPVYKRRKFLQQVRSDIQSKINSGLAIESIQKYMTEKIKILVEDLIKEVTNDISASPPCNFAILSLGSFARGEMCPFSDLEFAILLEHDSEDAVTYFRNLTRLLELKVVNFGETPFCMFKMETESVNPDGFRYDSGGNTPLGKEGLFELIGTPAQLAKFQSKTWFQSDMIMSNAMRTVDLCYGSKYLKDTYLENMECILNENSNSIIKGVLIPLHKERALQLLKAHLQQFCPELNEQKNRLFGVKKELYRPLTCVIEGLALYYGLSLGTVSTYARIEGLCRLGIITKEACKNLLSVLQEISELRIRTQMFYAKEMEILYQPPPNASGESPDEIKQNQDLLHITEEDTQKIIKIYQVLLPLHDTTNNFVKLDGTCNTYMDISLMEDTLLNKAYSYSMVSQYSTALSLLNQAISLNANDTDAMCRLAVTYWQIQDHDKAITTAEDTLKIAQAQKNSSKEIQAFILLAKYSGNLANQEKFSEYGYLALEKAKDANLHPTMLADLYWVLANVNQRAYQYEESEKYFCQLLSVLKNLPTEIFQYISALSNLASLHLEQWKGDDPISFNHLKEADKLTLLAVSSLSLANLHHYQAVVITELLTIEAWIELIKGNLAQALEYGQQAIKCSASYESNPLVKANCFKITGRILLQLDRHSEAVDYIVCCYKILLEAKFDLSYFVKGVEGILAIDTMANKSFSEGDWVLAEKLYLLCDAPQFNHLLDERTIAKYKIALGKIARKKGDLDTAIFYQLQIESKYSSCEDLLSEALMQLGLISKSQGKLEEAEQYYRKALQTMENLEGSESINLAGILCNLGNLLALQTRYSEALVQFRRVQQLMQKYKKLESVVGPAVNLGIASCLRRDELDQQHVNTAVDTAIKHHGVRSPLVEQIKAMHIHIPEESKTLSELEQMAAQEWERGKSLRVQGSLVEAEGHLRMSLALYRKCYPNDDNLHIASVLHSLGGVLFNLSNHVEGLSYSMEALQLKEKYCGSYYINEMIGTSLMSIAQMLFPFQQSEGVKHSYMSVLIFLICESEYFQPSCNVLMLLLSKFTLPLADMKQSLMLALNEIVLKHAHQHNILPVRLMNPTIQENRNILLKAEPVKTILAKFKISL